MTSHIGRFEIQGEIGRGGFGKVYRAFDPKVGRVVAIKVLESGGDPGNQIRFRNEATAAGNLQHKNIVTIYEFGEENGVQYLVMQYLQGQDLQKALKAQPPLPLLKKVSIMSEVADGLGFAHRNGVLHRDIKPANIMLLDDGNVKIMDFGIARLMREYATRLTQTGFLVGSVAYMAPEQFLGQDVDARCDIWSYGVTFYEMLCGRNPFETGNPFSEMHKITGEEPPPLDVLDCPEALKEIVGRLLKKDRELRYQSFEDVLFDIEPLLGAMQKEEAAGLLAQAREWVGQQQWDKAQALIRAALELDVQNREARALREQIQNEIRRITVRPRVEALIKRGDEEAQQRRFTEAIELLDSARKLDSGNIEVESRLKDLRAAKENSDRAKQLAADAKQELEGNRLTTAFDRLVDALRVDADHPEAKQLLGRVQQEMEARERERQLEEKALRASVLVDFESFDEALTLLRELTAAHPSRADFKEALERAAALKSAKERRDLLSERIESAQALLKNGELEAAVQRISDFLRDFPESQELAGLLAEARAQIRSRARSQAVDAIRSKAAALIESHRYEEAMDAIQNAMRDYPDEPALSRLLQTAISERRAHEEQERQYIQSRLEAIGERERAQDWAGANALIREARAAYPNDAALAAAERRVEQSSKEFERRREIAAETRTMRALLIAGDWPKALARIQDARARYGDEAVFEDLREEAGQRRELERNGLLTKIRGLLASGRLDATDAALQAARERFGDDPELTALAAERAQAQQMIEELRRAQQTRAETDRIRADQASAEAERLRAEQARAEKERQEQLRAEQARAEAERVRAEQARAEAERLRAEQARAEKERQEQLRAEQARAQAERARAEQARTELERLRAEQVRAEQIRQEQARAEQTRAEQARAEAERARVEQSREQREREKLPPPAPEELRNRRRRPILWVAALVVLLLAGVILDVVHSQSVARQEEARVATERAQADQERARELQEERLRAEQSQGDATNPKVEGRGEPAPPKGRQTGADAGRGKQQQPGAAAGQIPQQTKPQQTKAQPPPPAPEPVKEQPKEEQARVEVPQTAQPPRAQPPAPPATPACVAESGDISGYHGARHGTLRWVSVGKRSTRVEIFGRQADVGRIVEGANQFPNWRVTVSSPQQGVRIVQAPNNCNGRHLVIEKPADLDQVDIDWTAQ